MPAFSCVPVVIRYWKVLMKCPMAMTRFPLFRWFIPFINQPSAQNLSALRWLVNLSMHSWFSFFCWRLLKSLINWDLLDKLLSCWILLTLFMKAPQIICIDFFACYHFCFMAMELMAGCSIRWISLYTVCLVPSHFFLSFRVIGSRLHLCIADRGFVYASCMLEF